MFMQVHSSHVYNQGRIRREAKARAGKVRARAYRQNKNLKNVLQMLRIFRCQWTCVHLSSVTQSCQLCDPMDCSTPGFPVHHQHLELARLMSIKLVMSLKHLILCHPFLLLPSIFPSISIFSNKSVLCIRWPKYWSFSFNISPSNEYSGLISFRIDWFLSPYNPKDSQESSPTPQFKSINSLALTLLFDSTLTSIHDYRKNHSFD